MFEKFASNILQDLLDEIDLKKSVAKEQKKALLDKISKDVSDVMVELQK
jgi:flagellar hook-basal body complex protein FliE